MSIRTKVGRVGGRGRFNGPEDVRTIKVLLNTFYPLAGLTETPTMDESTIGYIERFQHDEVKMKNPDGYVSPRGKTWRTLLKLTADKRYPILVNQCLRKPKYSDLQTAYDSYRIDNAPCKSGVTNQCAVRMSIAMVRSGLDFAGFEKQSRVHAGRRSCKTSIPHVLGANELAKYLITILGAPRRFTRAERDDAEQRIQRKKGIIYFDNCFTRSGQKSKKGDHIDLWTGKNYYNQLIGIGAGGDAGAEAKLFARSNGGIWFWQLA